MRGQGKQKLFFIRKTFTKGERQVLRLLYPEKVERPVIRAECEDGIRPCPFVGCRHNLYIEAKHTGSIRQNFDCEPWDVPPDKSCSLDLCNDKKTMEEVGAILNITRERVRQIEEKTLAKLARKLLNDPDMR